jgi:hypothetical protein
VKIQNIVRTIATRKYRRSLAMTLALLMLASFVPVKGGTSLATPTSMTSAAAAGSDFVYVLSSFVTFNDDNPERTFHFTLPSNVTGRGHIMVQAKGVDFSCNRFEINGTQVNVLVDRDGSGEVDAEYNDISSGVLHGGDNTLFIQTRNESCGLGGNLDDFSITNIVIFYKTL